jgi:beta-lactamase superfamily II metal-dependent hydrolase
MEIHFISVGCGNMTALLYPNGTVHLYDCNVTDDNADDVMAYFSKAMGQRKTIDAFICSHRDADHMRGVKVVHDSFPISEIWDTDVPGTTTDSPEYLDYMDLRRRLTSKVIEPRKYQEFGEVLVRWMNSKDDRFSDANDQSIVMKLEYKGNAALLAGDTSYRPWKETIMPHYAKEKIKADILLAAHHGSLTFFDDPADEKNYYTAHVDTIKPAMTIVSVGPNVHDLPDQKALELYEKKSSGSDKGNKLYTTQDQGNIKLLLNAMAPGGSSQSNETDHRGQSHSPRP